MTDPEKGREFEHLRAEYEMLLIRYQQLFSEIKALRRQNPAPNPETLASVRVIDKERDDVHRKLIEIGQALGKDRDTVLIDILQKQGSLEQYGLPEFVVLKEEDIAEPEFNFQLDEQSEKIQHGNKQIRPRENCIIVYDVSAVYYDGDGEVQYPEDYEIKLERAKKSAERLNGELVDIRDGETYHEATLSVTGVKIPKKNLEQAASVIRDNPELRIGKEFY